MTRQTNKNTQNKTVPLLLTHVKSRRTEYLPKTSKHTQKMPYNIHLETACGNRAQCCYHMKSRISYIWKSECNELVTWCPECHPALTTGMGSNKTPLVPYIFIACLCEVQEQSFLVLLVIFIN